MSFFFHKCPFGQQRSWKITLEIHTYFIHIGPTTFWGLVFGAIKHCLDFSSVCSAPLPAGRNLFSGSRIFWGGRYQPPGGTSQNDLSKGLSMVFDLFPRITYLFLITLRQKSGLSSDHGSGTDLKPWKGLYSAPSPIQKNYITKFLKVYYKVWCFVAHHPGPFSSINWVQMPFWRKLKYGLTKFFKNEVVNFAGWWLKKKWS